MSELMRMIRTLQGMLQTDAAYVLQADKVLGYKFCKMMCKLLYLAGRFVLTKLRLSVTVALLAPVSKGPDFRRNLRWSFFCLGRQLTKLADL